MIKIGLLSDTHGYLGDYVYRFFEDCDEVWHAGDIGSIDVLNTLKNFKPFRAVYGNIDGSLIKKEVPAIQQFSIEGMNVFIKHIVGYPNKYDKNIIPILQSSKYNLVIGGHSHILRIMYDKKYNWLFVNPGAAGLYGFHTKITLVKLFIDNAHVKGADIWERNR